MATAESVKAKIQGLIDVANAATGGTDADLTAAVQSLIAGYGQDSGAGINSITVTPTEVIATVTLPVLIGKQNIIFIPRFTPTADMVSSGRITGLCMYFRGAFYVSTRTSSTNTTWSATATQESYGSTSTSYFVFDPETGKIGGVGGTNGQMVAQPYEISYW